MTLRDQIANYHMPTIGQYLLNETRVLLVASVVGGGKNTIISELMKTGEFHRVISHTTRKPRVNHGQLETEGHDYHFVSLEEAQRLVDQEAFIEVKYVHDNVYGTSVAEIQAAFDEDKTAIMDIDVQGVNEYLAVKPDSHAVFLLPPSVDTWLNRLERRYGNLTDHAAEIKRRFQSAYREIQHIQTDDRYILVINDELQTTVDRVKGVMDGSVDHTSEYALAVTEHLLDYLKTQI